MQVSLAAAFQEKLTGAEIWIEMNLSFEERWKRKWTACGFDDSALYDIHIELIPCGSDVLPNEAAPFLTFGCASNPRQIWEVFGIPSQWSEAERQRLSPYRMIGSDSAGNPICVVQDTGEVVLLDHEDRFRTLQFVNSSVGQLAECLLAYMGEKQPDPFRSALQTIDRAALVEGTFWWHEANGLNS